MKNPNDMAAIYYDKIYYSEISDRQTSDDLKIIKKQIRKGSILDVACGTGRHMIPLLKTGYEVIGVDISPGMLRVLRQKLKQEHLHAKIINHDIKNFKTSRKFSGIILFWNAMNEIAINEKQAKNVAKDFYRLLEKESSVILDFSVSVPKNGISEYSIKDGKTFYKIIFKNNYNKKSRVSKDTEILEIFRNGKRIKKGKARYTHKWWTKNEIYKIFKEAGFTSVKFLKRPQNQTILMVAKK